MGWFKWRKRRGEDSLVQDRLALRIAGEVLGFQRRLADRLNAMAAKVNKKWLLGVLIGVGLLFGGYCGWLVYGIFND